MGSDLYMDHLIHPPAKLIKKIYVVKYNSDTTEGRGPSAVYGYYDDPAKAMEAALQTPTVMGVSLTSDVTEHLLNNEVGDGLKRSISFSGRPESYQCTETHWPYGRPVYKPRFTPAEIAAMKQELVKAERTVNELRTKLRGQ